jgi:hypothetical protein
MNEPSTASTSRPRLFPRTVLDAITEGKMIGIRAGTEHRFTGVWVVVVRGRVFVRSWNDKAHGWYRAFVNEPRGSMQLPGQQIPVRARRTRGDRLLDAIDLAYREKYDTKASQKWVRGFRRTRRRMTTTELVPQ